MDVVERGGERRDRGVQPNPPAGGKDTRMGRVKLAG